MPRKQTRPKGAGAALARPAPSRNVSRAEHIPDERSRQIVTLSMAIGYTHDQTAHLIGISRPTLEKHYRQELDEGADKINAVVARNLYRIITQQDDIKASLTATIFWLKTRLGWRETAQTAEVDVSHDGPMRVKLIIGDRGPGDGD